MAGWRLVNNEREDHFGMAESHQGSENWMLMDCKCSYDFQILIFVPRYQPVERVRETGD